MSDGNSHGDREGAIAVVPPRLHIAGSASPSCDRALLELAHLVVGNITGIYAAAGGSFVVGIGGEPTHGEGSPALVFDWTVLETALAALQSGATAPQTSRGPLVIAGASQRGREQVPERRRAVIAGLHEFEALDLRVLPEGWRSGALIRIEQANAGEVLLTLGGGAGVEHLANLYAQSGRAIIPLDFEIGSSRGDDVVGGSGLAARAIRSPSNFIRLRTDAPVAGRLDAITTRGAGMQPDVLIDRIIHLIRDIEPPRCFYVRLLDSSNPAFAQVETFFRHVVDPVVAAAGFASFEMGRDAPEHAWMNDEIFAGLYFSSLVVIDLTELRPNCLTELGYALGRGQRLIITAREGTRPPFDLDKIPWFFWAGDAEVDRLRSELAEHLRLYSSRPPLVVVPRLI